MAAEFFLIFAFDGETKAAWLNRNLEVKALLKKVLLTVLASFQILLGH